MIDVNQSSNSDAGQSQQQTDTAWPLFLGRRIWAIMDKGGSKALEESKKLQN